jgi:hypothetical protein
LGGGTTGTVDADWVLWCTGSGCDGALFELFVLVFPVLLLLLLVGGCGGGLLLIGPLWVYGALEILLFCCTFAWTGFSTTAA